MDEIKIVPGISVGCIALNQPIESALNTLGEQYCVTRMFDNIIELNHGELLLLCREDRSIAMIKCQGRYKELLWSGMSIGEVLKISETHIIYDDKVIVNHIHGIALEMPLNLMMSKKQELQEKWDSLENMSLALGKDFSFQYLCVYDPFHYFK